MIAQDNPTYEKQPNHRDVHGGGLEMLSKAISGKTKACVSGFVLSKAQQKMVTVSSISSLLHVIFWWFKCQSQGSHTLRNQKCPFFAATGFLHTFSSSQTKQLRERNKIRRFHRKETQSKATINFRTYSSDPFILIQVIHSYLIRSGWVCQFKFGALLWYDRPPIVFASSMNNGPQERGDFKGQTASSSFSLHQLSFAASRRTRRRTVNTILFIIVIQSVFQAFSLGFFRCKFALGCGNSCSSLIFHHHQLRHMAPLLIVVEFSNLHKCFAFVPTFSMETNHCFMESQSLSFHWLFTELKPN